MSRPTGSRPHRGLVVILGTLAALCGGCSRYQAPELKLVEAMVAEETEQGMVLSFALAATNENEVALPLKEVRYSLKLDGQEVFSGQRSAEATLRRKGTQRIVLPAAFPWKELDRPGDDVRYELKGEVSYVTPGQVAELLFDTGVRRPSVSFKEEGLLPPSAVAPGVD